jgi:hypothetical protein
MDIAHMKQISAIPGLVLKIQVSFKFLKSMYRNLRGVNKKVRATDVMQSQLVQKTWIHLLLLENESLINEVKVCEWRCM